MTQMVKKDKEYEVTFQEIDEENKFVFGEEGPLIVDNEPEFGSSEYFENKFAERKENLIPGFLNEQLDEILNKEYKEKHEIKQYLLSLIETYHDIRTSKIKI
jgi:hypothetical protein